MLGRSGEALRNFGDLLASCLKKKKIILLVRFKVAGFTFPYLGEIHLRIVWVVQQISAQKVESACRVQIPTQSVVFIFSRIPREKALLRFLYLSLWVK